MKKLLMIAMLCLLCLPLVLADELEFSDVSIDGKSVDHRDVVDNIHPEDEIEIDVEVENTFSKSSRMDINDIKVTVIIQDIKKGEDIELRSKEFDLGSSDNKQVSMSFKVPLKVEHREQYKIIIRAEGFDEQDELHEVLQTNYIEIKKVRHSVRIMDARVSPSRLVCDRNANIDVRVVNQGRGDEDDAAIRISNQDLGVLDIGEFLLEEDPFDEDYERLVSFAITVPDTAAPGVYPLLIESLYDKTVLSEKTSVDLEIESCYLFENLPPKVQVDSFDEPEFEPTGLSTRNQETVYIGFLTLILGLVIVSLVLMLIYHKKNNTSNADEERTNKIIVFDIDDRGDTPEDVVEEKKE